ncbi:hypothetical protein Cgig2_016592 [Carnegiea gigantea]|uniref:Uncharacterized protein n=1 Tax=Carnegiea gigantea TaxID=171969 RepID=A0A9Q1QSI2_9CARY|nr:hypothetical protein Cgig2_016592 [Carnegiea gigantea]
MATVRAQNIHHVRLITPIFIVVWPLPLKQYWTGVFDMSTRRHGSPKHVKDGCTKCENKVDDGDEFVCCDDCTYPEMVYDDSSSGYCKSGAELISQPKPKEVFAWVTGPWLACSSPCGGGVRSRRVECFAVVEATSSPDYPVYDDRCSDQEKPVKQEPCNLQRCVDEFVNHAETNQKRQRTSTWKAALLIFFGVVALVAVGFAGFIFHTRRATNQQGYVYIMMGEYS